MNAPQIIVIVLLSLDLLGTAYLHGKPKNDKHNIFGTLIGTGLTVLLLAWGGFF